MIIPKRGNLVIKKVLGDLFVVLQQFFSALDRLFSQSTYHYLLYKFTTALGFFYINLADSEK